MQLFFHEHLGVQIVDVSPKSKAHFHKFKTTAHEIESFFATVKYPFGPFCADTDDDLSESDTDDDTIEGNNELTDTNAE